MCANNHLLFHVQITPHERLDCAVDIYRLWIISCIPHREVRKASEWTP
jgi:hypothetical protein